ncbi:MAG TPA: hypothetical protein VJ965_12365 [Anaerolineales bacterium]|nr:hypothetical protein [Anaerolineales bacterium]
MTAWINFGLMVLFTIVFVGLYNRSVSPAALEKKMGADSYPYCGRLRAVAIGFLILVMACYIAYAFNPLPIRLPEKFAWSYWISALIAVFFAAPTTYMVMTGMKDAGSEAIAPSKENEMYGGIYEKIRHPQTWEYGYFFAIAFLLNSPFLALYSLVWLPLAYIMMRAEEKDLLIRFGIDYQNYMEKTGRLLPRRKNI